MGNVIKKIGHTSRVSLVISDKNWLESKAVDQLIQTTTLKGVCCSFGMPDLHPGKGQPIGAAFISENIIYPHLVGSDIGCGMGFWQLNVPAKKVKLDRWEKKLKGLDEELSAEEMNNYIKHTQLFKKINFNVDDYCSYNRKLGTIGGGNHFAELQKVNTVYDIDTFSNNSLHKDGVYMLVHSGSRGLGQHILRDSIDRFGSKGLIAESDAGKNYLEKHDYANRWARLNRQVIANRFMECLSVTGKWILDVSHNYVEKLSIKSMSALDLNTTQNDYFIHRKGASSSEQALVMIPGSRGSLSYLVKPIGDVSKLAKGGLSLAHGAGRKWKRSDVKGRLEKRYTQQDILKTAFNSRVICNNKDLAYEESPQAYKNIDTVVQDLVDAGMITVIASFQPIISYKTRRSK